MLKENIGEEADTTGTTDLEACHCCPLIFLPPQNTRLATQLWELKDYLNKNCQLRELKTNLDLNGRTATGGKDSLVSRVADGIIFGRATCAACPSGTPGDCQISFEDGMNKQRMLTNYL